MNSTREEICAAAVRIYARMSFIHLSLIFRLISTPLCCLGITLLTIAVYRTKALHYNARLLILCMTVSSLVCNLGVFLDSAYKLYISSLPADAIRCQYEVYRPQYYFALRGLNVAGGVSFGLSTTFLAVERVLATVSYSTYEQNNRRWLGILMAFMQILISFCAGFAIHPPSQFYPYVSPEVGDSKLTKMFGHMFYLLNVAALCVFTVLYFVNRRRRRILCDSQLRVLSTRFQLKENIATTRLMTPIMFVEALMLTSSQLLYYFYLPDLGEDTVVTKTVLDQVSRYAPYAEYQPQKFYKIALITASVTYIHQVYDSFHRLHTISLMPILGFLLIVLLPCFHTQIKRSFIRTSHLGLCCPERSSLVDAVTVDEARDLYFAKLNGQWSENVNNAC